MIIPEDVDKIFLLSADFGTVKNLGQTNSRFTKYVTSVDFWREKTYHDFGTGRNFDEILKWIGDPEMVYLRVADWNFEPIFGSSPHPGPNFYLNLGCRGDEKTIDYFFEEAVMEAIGFIIQGLIFSRREHLVDRYFPRYKESKETLGAVVRGYAQRGEIYQGKIFPLLDEVSYYLEILRGAIEGHRNSLFLEIYEKLISKFGITSKIYKAIYKLISDAAKKNNTFLVEKLIYDKRTPKYMQGSYQEAALGYSMSGNLLKLQEILPLTNATVKDDFTDIVKQAVLFYWKDIVDYIIEINATVDWEEIMETVLEFDIIELFPLIHDQVNRGSYHDLAITAIKSNAPLILNYILKIGYAFLPQSLLIETLYHDDNWKSLAEIIIGKYSSDLINQTINGHTIQIIDVDLLRLIELGGSDFSRYLPIVINEGKYNCLSIVLSKVSQQEIDRALIMAMETLDPVTIQIILEAGPTNIDQAINLIDDNEIKLLLVSYLS